MTYSEGLPALYTKPTFQELVPLLQTQSTVKNFSESEVSAVQDPIFKESIVVWLTKLISHPLGWLSDEEREKIIDLAAKKLSQVCGFRSAGTREVEVTEGTVIRLEEPGVTEDALGLKTWGSAMVLSRRIANDPSILEAKFGSRMLELGAGTGLVGLVAAKYCPVVMTDLAEVLENLRVNVSANQTPYNVEVEELDWRNPAKSSLFGQRFSTLLVSDPIYDMEHSDILAKVIDMYLEKPNKDQEILGGRLILQLPLRRRFEPVREKFWNNLRNRNKMKRVVQELEHDRDDFGDMDYSFEIWEHESSE